MANLSRFKHRGRSVSDDWRGKSKKGVDIRTQTITTKYKGFEIEKRRFYEGGKQFNVVFTVWGKNNKLLKTWHEKTDLATVKKWIRDYIQKHEPRRPIASKRRKPYKR